MWGGCGGGAGRGGASALLALRGGAGFAASLCYRPAHPLAHRCAPPPTRARRRSATRRVVGDMAKLSGAAGISYLEYSTQAGGGGRGRGRARPLGQGKLAKMAKRYG